MKKALKRIQASELYYYKDGEKIVIEKKYYDKLEIDLGDGVVNYIRGDVSFIRGNVSFINGDVSSINGDVSSISGDVSSISGDVSSISGDVSSISGDVDECAITEEERQKGIDIIDLVE